MGHSLVSLNSIPWELKGSSSTHSTPLCPRPVPLLHCYPAWPHTGNGNSLWFLDSSVERFSWHRPISGREGEGVKKGGSAGGYSLCGTAPANAAARLQLQSCAFPTHPARQQKRKEKAKTESSRKTNWNKRLMLRYIAYIYRTDPSKSYACVWIFYIYTAMQCICV